MADAQADPKTDPTIRALAEAIASNPELVVCTLAVMVRERSDLLREALPWLRGLAGDGAGTADLVARVEQVVQ